MTILTGILSAIFVVLAIMIVSKSLSLTKAAPATGEESEVIGESTANKWNGYGMLAFLILGTIGGVWSYIHYEPYFMHEAASDVGVRTDELFWTVMIIITLSFYLTFVFLCYFATYCLFY